MCPLKLVNQGTRGCSHSQEGGLHRSLFLASDSSVKATKPRALLAIPAVQPCIYLQMSLLELQTWFCSQEYTKGPKPFTCPPRVFYSLLMQSKPIYDHSWHEDKGHYKMGHCGGWLWLCFSDISGTGPWEMSQLGCRAHPCCLCSLQVELPQ